MIYPLDYGYLDGSMTTDGQGIDVFRGAASGTGVIGVIVCVDSRKKDAEIKILVDCSDEEIDLAHSLLASLQLGTHLIRRKQSTVEIA